MSKVVLTDSAKIERLRDVMRPVLTYFNALIDGRDYYGINDKKAAKAVAKLQEMEEIIENYLPEIKSLLFGDGNFPIGSYRMLEVEKIAKYHAIGLCGLHQHNGQPITKDIVEAYFDASMKDILEEDSIRKSTKEYDKIMKQ